MLMKRKTKQQSGFTLIELIVVMMILAILVATAAPKFLSFQVDARKAAVDGLKASIESASQLVYGKAVLVSAEGNSGETPVGPAGDIVTTVYGYPRATMAGIGAAVTGVGIIGSGEDWELTPKISDGSATIKLKGSDITSVTQCYLTYVEAKSAILPATVTNSCDSTISAP